MAYRQTSRPDIATIAGVGVAFACILGGLVLEKGNVKDVAQITAALIVVGGTAGAVMVSSPMRTIMSAIAHLKPVFFESSHNLEGLIDEIIGYASKARKQGIVSLEAEAGTISDPFLRKAMNLAVDGADIDELKAMMELEIEQRENVADEAAKVFESGGGYAPTIGIIGAVLGLIQVMKNLENISEVGHGIAVAFVATLYGVGIANILLLPAAAKIRARSAADTRMRELSLQGVVGMIEGSNPKLIRARLEAYLNNAKASARGGNQQRMAA